MSYLPSLGYKCSKLVIEIMTAIVNDGKKVSVNNGEDWIILPTNNLSHIVNNLNSRNKDLIRIYCTKNRSKVKVGWLEITYDNNLDQPLSIITKHADNDYIQQLLAPIYDSWE